MGDCQFRVAAAVSESEGAVSESAPPDENNLVTGKSLGGGRKKTLVIFQSTSNLSCCGARDTREVSYDQNCNASAKLGVRHHTETTARTATNREEQSMENQTSAHSHSIDRMLAVWNERDLSLVRCHLESALTPDITFVDPTIETHGLGEFEENVRDFRTKYPQAGIRRMSGIDSHHNIHRYSWEIAIAGEVVLFGFDVAETAEDGKVCRVLGFFGPLPKLSQ